MGKRQSGTNTISFRNVAVQTEDFFMENVSKESYGACEWIAIGASIFLMIITLPLSLLCVVKVVDEYERAVILRLGKMRKGRPRGPGIFFVLPCTDGYFLVNLRIETFVIPPQEILTKDSCTVIVDAVVYFKIVNPLTAVVRVENYRRATLLMAATTLRNVLGQENIIDILSERSKLAAKMRDSLDVVTFPWGVAIERVEMKDVKLPPDMQRAMAAEAEATRDARAKIIVAEGELKASEAMKDASETIGTSDAALQLRYLQTLTSIKNEQTSTYVFPMPIKWLRLRIGHSLLAHGHHMTRQDEPTFPECNVLLTIKYLQTDCRTFKHSILLSRTFDRR